MPQPASGTPGSASPGSTVLGYPRIGPRRELKRAVEGYWSADISASELLDTAHVLRAQTWTELVDSGLDSIPGNTFSLYDHVLDTAVLFGAVPTRFTSLDLSELDTYFAMARGHDDAAPMELTKWFDTNYHHLVPEIDPGTRFALAGDKPVAEFTEAAAMGVVTRPVLLGPVSFLLLAKPGQATSDSFVPLDLLDPLLDRYVELLDRLAAAGAAWVQLDEPSFVADRSERELAALDRAYQRLGGLVARPRLLVTGSYGDLGPALDVLAATPVEAIGVDLVSAPHLVARLAGVPNLRDKTLVAGVVDGRNVWRTDLPAALATCVTLLGLVGDLVVSTSCSLLHVPYDVTEEDGIEPAVRDRLAFARQKVAEVVLLGRGLREGTGAVTAELAGESATRAGGLTSTGPDVRVRARLDALTPDHLRRADR
ncbi:MAG TPA: 5-methyltetrahydropteroyltriglutamate--homocysteine S-methyltransferase, partial [Mycobacteriales bacterium]